MVFVWICLEDISVNGRACHGYKSRGVNFKFNGVDALRVRASFSLYLRAPTSTFATLPIVHSHFKQVEAGLWPPTERHSFVKVPGSSDDATI